MSLFSGSSYEFCFMHQMIRLAGDVCAACARETAVSDLAADVQSLRRQVNDLRHMVQDLQQAHNAHIRLDEGATRAFARACMHCGRVTVSDMPILVCEQCGR